MARRPDNGPTIFDTVNAAGYLLRPRSGRLTSFSLIGLKSRLTSDGSTKADSTPLVVPVRLPSIQQRLHMYERAGAIKAAFYDDLADDDFQDELDDLPEDGLSPHELADSDFTRDADIARSIRKRAKEASDAAKAVPATLLPGDPAGSPKAKPQGSPDPAGGG